MCLPSFGALISERGLPLNPALRTPQGSFTAIPSYSHLTPIRLSDGLSTPTSTEAVLYTVRLLSAAWHTRDAPKSQP